MSDEELLLKYRKYKKKRFIIIGGITFLLILILSVILYFHFNNTSSTEPKVNSKEDVVIKDKDAPIIKLKIKEIEIMKGDDINYKDYIESVEDKIDGNLIEEVQYEIIDTSIVGEHSIIYSVSDKAGNTSQAILKVIIKETEEQVDTNNSKTGSTENKSNSIKNDSDNKNSESKPSQKEEQNSQTPKQEETTKNDNNTSEKIVKYFLFSDGYTMLNVSDACATELKKINRTGMCSPIQDENGIYLGMKLETN